MSSRAAAGKSEDAVALRRLEALRSAPLRRLVGQLPGYDAGECGAVTEVA